MSRDIEDYGAYLHRMETEGYIGDKGQPLKCLYCDSKELDERNTYYENHYIVEYQVYCKKCDKTVGQWSYGRWEG